MRVLCAGMWVLSSCGSVDASFVHIHVVLGGFGCIDSSFVRRHVCFKRFGIC